MGDSGEKTEKATAKKRRDARSRGQVLKSTEANTAFCSIVMFSVMLIVWPSMVSGLTEIVRTYITVGFDSLNAELDYEYMRALFISIIMNAIGIVAPVMVVSMVSGIAINLIQVGFMFTTKPLAPKFSKINPLQGFKRLFSPSTLVELVKSLIKVGVLGYFILYREYVKLIDKFPTLIGAELYTTFVEIMRTAFTIALKMSAVLVALALFDYLYQWWKYEKDLKMTKQEVKEEYKQMEGDPQIKSRIRQKQRQMSAMRMMAEVPGADVVITNPTHLAVALKYDEKVGGAPVIVAMGADYMARRIKDIARENGIHIIENKPLARSLYELCEVGDQIPAELYQAVADILVYVYRQKRRIS